jgi:CheY-like chemotaxis protein
MGKYRVMIIDDDEDARRVLNLALSPRYEVIEACDGLDALSMLESCEPDFAIIDIMMPLMDGYQVCEAIRRHPRFSQMQVMFLSAYGSKENVKRGYAAGANLFMTKPVDPERVLRNIDFTIQHDPPALRTKRYAYAELLRHNFKPQGAPAQPPPAAPQVPRAAAQATPPPRPVAFTPPREAATTRPRPAAAETAPAGKPRILVVDDDIDMLQMVSLSLRDTYVVTLATNGLEAIERMVDYEPDLLLLDIMMPKMNGYQMLQSIRRNACWKSLPVVVISAKSTPKDREYAARLGSTGFLAKPYHVDELLRLLEDICAAPAFRVRNKKLTYADIKEKLHHEAMLREDHDREVFHIMETNEIRRVAREGGRPE